MKRYEKLRELREDAGISRQRLSSYLCVHQTTYSEYELGKINVPVDVFIKLSRLYGVSIEYILGLTRERIIPRSDIKAKLQGPQACYKMRQ